MLLFKKSSKKDSMIKNLLTFTNSDQVFESLTALQNEIGVGYSTKVIAVTSINNEDLAAAFARGLSKTFAYNGSSSYLIDANLYNPSLERVYVNEDGSSELTLQSSLIKDKEQVEVLKQETYPSEVYKNKAIHHIVDRNKDRYDHFVIIVPPINKHKELALLNDLVDSVILVTERNKTTRGSIYEAAAFCQEAKLPLAKTVIIK